MKKLIILCAIYLVPILSQAQTWDTFKIDSTVSVKLPKGFRKIDTDIKYSLSARTSFGTILFFKTPDMPMVTPDIEKDRHLKKFYDSYIKSIKSSSSDAIIKDEADNLIGELKVKDFTLQTDTGGGIMFRDFRILHANGATYIFEFLYQKIHEEYAIPERNKFFNSIEVNENLSRSDQYTSQTLNPEKSDNTKYLLWGGIVILISVGMTLFLVIRKKGQCRNL
jgi:hypothetical protein